MGILLSGGCEAKVVRATRYLAVQLGPSLLLGRAGWLGACPLRSNVGSGRSLPASSRSAKRSKRMRGRPLPRVRIAHLELDWGNPNMPRQYVRMTSGMLQRPVALCHARSASCRAADRYSASPAGAAHVRRDEICVRRMGRAVRRTASPATDLGQGTPRWRCQPGRRVPAAPNLHVGDPPGDDQCRWVEFPPVVQHPSSGRSGFRNRLDPRGATPAASRR